MKYGSLRVTTNILICLVALSCSSPVVSVYDQKPSGKARYISQVSGDILGHWVGFGTEAVTGAYVSQDSLTTTGFFSNDQPVVDQVSLLPEFNGTPNTYSIYVENSQDLADKLNLNSSVAVSYGGSTFGSSYNQSVLTKTSESSATFLIYKHYYYGYYQTWGGEQLTQAAIAQLQTDVGGFVKKYGNSFLKRVYIGGDIGMMCTYTFSQSSSEDIQKFKTTLKMNLDNVFGLSGSVQLDSSQKALIKKTSLSMRSFTDLAGYATYSGTITDTTAAVSVFNSEQANFEKFLIANHANDPTQCTLPAIKKVYANYDATIYDSQGVYRNILSNLVNLVSWKRQWQDLASRISDINNSTFTSATLRASCQNALTAIGTQLSSIDLFSTSSCAPSATEYKALFDQADTEKADWLNSQITWQTNHWKNQGYSPIVDFININNPSNLLEIRSLNSQLVPSGDYDFYTFVRNSIIPSPPTPVYSGTITQTRNSSTWVADVLTGLNTGTQVPLFFWKSSSSGPNLYSIHTNAPSPSKATWDYFHQTDGWNLISSWLNRPENSPADLTGVIVLCCQMQPSGSYDMWVFARKDQSTVHSWNLSTSYISSNWTTDALNTLKTGKATPVAFWESSAPPPNQDILFSISH